MRYIIILMALTLASCQLKKEDDHAHDASGGHIDEGNEIPTVDTTIWTDKTELFIEFPALIVGEVSRFAAHFTIMEKHRPVKEGSVTVSLIKGNSGIRHTVETPSSPGIFTPSLQPKEAGIYDELVFELKTPAGTDTMVINDVPVFASIDEAKETLDDAEEDGGAITFLKEQAWKIDFQTAKVIRSEIFDAIPTSGVWTVSPTDVRTLVATTGGTVNFQNENLIEGSKVRNGRTLMTVSSDRLTSNNLRAEIQRAKAEYDQAKAEYDRKKQLHESKIVPTAELEKVEQRYRVAQSTYETLSAGYSEGGKQVTVPFNGYIKSIAVSNGEFVEQGAALVTITSHQSSLLKTQVSSAYAAQLGELHDVWYQPRSDVWSSLNNTGGSLLSIGKEVESNQPLLAVFAKVNEVVQMPEGSFTEVQITYGQPSDRPVIPESALLEDYGNYSVIVQLSGESFERRPVILGRRNGSEVEIKEGLAAGEVVVSTGAYQVKMASMSGQVPAHGHEH